MLAEGDASLSVDELVNVRRCYLRATEYYRQAFFYARDDLDSPQLHAGYDGHGSAFRAALPLLPSSCRAMEVAQNGTAAMGYLLLPDDSSTPRPTVDPEALVMFGRSFAGYLAPRGATGGQRLAALICDPPHYDFAASVRSQTGDAVWERLVSGDPLLEADLAPMIADPRRRNAFGSRMGCHGVSTLADYFRELSRFSSVGLADRITCPTLALIADGDFADTGQLDVFAEALEVPVTTHRFTVAEGPGALRGTRSRPAGPWRLRVDHGNPGRNS